MTEQTLLDFYPGDEVVMAGNQYFVARYYPLHEGIDLSLTQYGAAVYLSLSVGTSQIRLVRRGNGFRRATQMELLPFADYGQEVQFWHLLNMTEQVPNHRTSRYEWKSWEEVIEDLEEGRIDAFMGASGLPGMPMEYVSFSGYKINDPVAAVRVRHLFLAELRSLQPA